MTSGDQTSSTFAINSSRQIHVPRPVRSQSDAGTQSGTTAVGEAFVGYDLTMTSSLRVDFDSDPAARYEILLRPADAATGDGVVLVASPRACSSFARLFAQLAEAKATHVHLGYTEEEPQGPGFRITVDSSGRSVGTEEESSRPSTVSEAETLPFVPGKWKETLLPSYEQSLWLDLLEEDVLSAEISFAEYAALAQNLGQLAKDELAEANYRLMHFAKSFITAVRRVWWVLETADVSLFPPVVADAIKLERKKKKSFFEAYIEPRNAVEHASSEVKTPDKHVLTDLIYIDHEAETWHPIIARVHLRQSSLTLATGEAAQVTRSALTKIRDCYGTIMKACMTNLPRRTHELLLLGPVDVAGWRD